MDCSRLPGPAPVRVTPLQDSAFSATRFRIGRPRTGPHVVRMEAADAYVVLYQLCSHPVHDIRIDGRVVRSQPSTHGSLHVIDQAGDPCAWLEHPADTLMVHLPRPAVDALAREAGATWDGVLRAPVAWNTRDPVVSGLEPLLLDTLASTAPAHDLLHDQLMRTLGIHLVQAYGGLRQRRAVFRGGLAPWQERQAKERLSARLDQPVLIADVARAFGLSPDHFSRAFRVSTGMAPQAWLQRRRVEQAMHLLRSTASPLAGVATACGFSDQSHLSRVFARVVGCTPGAWRRAIAPRAHDPGAPR
ncbi:helix-turn-helix domain-containing protein [Pseudoxanthomonas sp. 10H]|uniref:helix-turn-helix domain-containing protein n=1 Tax=Pseudoxanthomonas sp. 10H TaxID=3242729 RepID=UPI00355812F1